jgi:3-methyladenine DNA glycosylase AlkD
LAAGARTAAAILRRLRRLANPANVSGMARFGINPARTLGISIPVLRRIAGEIGRDHHLAQALWASGVHEARILAGFIDDPARVTRAQMNRWAADFDSWDVCDQVCSSLFDRTPFAFQKAIEWTKRREEFVRRAGFVLMAALAVHDRQTPDGPFERFLRIIARGSADERNFVKKAVNWALRQIGKRNRRLNRRAIAQARLIQRMPSRGARWVAADALRELTGEAVRRKLTRAAPVRR